MKTILIDKKEIIIINAALLMEHYLLRNLYYGKGARWLSLQGESAMPKTT